MSSSSDAWKTYQILSHRLTKKTNPHDAPPALRKLFEPIPSAYKSFLPVRGEVTEYLLSHGLTGTSTSDSTESTRIAFPSVSSEEQCEKLKELGLPLAPVTKERESELPDTPVTEESPKGADEEKEKTTQKTVVIIGYAATKFPLGTTERAAAVGVALRILYTLDLGANATAPASTYSPFSEKLPSLLLKSAATSFLLPSTVPKLPLKIDGVIYASPEHYLSEQKMSFFDVKQSDIDLVHTAATPSEARSLAKQKLGSAFDAEAWNEVKEMFHFQCAYGTCRTQRQSYYELMATSFQPIQFEDSEQDSKRSAWSTALMRVRFYFLYEEFGANLLCHPGMEFAKKNRLVPMDGERLPGARPMQLVQKVLDRPIAHHFRKLLYAIHHSREDVIGIAIQQGLPEVMADLLYNESTEPALVDLCITVCALMSEDRGTLDRNLTNYLMRYYLHKREAWLALSYLSVIPYNYEMLGKAFQNVFGSRSATSDKQSATLSVCVSQLEIKDLMLLAASATVLKAQLSDPRSGTTMMKIASSDKNLFLCLDLLHSTNLKSKVDGWNNLQKMLGTSLMKILVCITNHVIEREGLEKISPVFVGQLISFLSSAFSEDIQAQCAIILEKTFPLLKSEEVVSNLLKSLESEFIQEGIPAPDCAVNLCDMLSAMSPTHPEAFDTLLAMGTSHYDEWALPLLSAVRNSIVASRGISQIPKFTYRIAPIIALALEHSDEGTVANVVGTTMIIANMGRKEEAEGEDGLPALRSHSILPMLLQWATETESQLQHEILDLCQLLTQDLKIVKAASPTTEGGEATNASGAVLSDPHTLELIIDLIPVITRAQYQAIVLQLLLNVANAGTPKSLFSEFINLTGLHKVCAKDNHKKVNRLLQALGVTLNTAGQGTGVAGEKKAEHVAKGEVDRMDYDTGTQNYFQLLVAKPKPSQIAAAAEKGAAAEKAKAEKKVETTSIAKVPKGFRVIQPKQRKEKASPTYKTSSTSYQRTNNKSYGSSSNRNISSSKNNRYSEKESAEGGRKYNNPSNNYYSNKYYDDYEEEEGDYYDNEEDNSNKYKSTGKTSAAVNKKYQENEKYVTKIASGVRIMERQAGTSTAATSTTKTKGKGESFVPKVIRAKGTSGQGVDLHALQQNMGLVKEIEQRKRDELASQKPKSWAGVAQMANKREQIAAEAAEEAAKKEQEAKEMKKKLEEEQAALREAQEKARQNTLSAQLKKLLPNTTISSKFATEKDIQEKEFWERKQEIRHQEERENAARMAQEKAMEEAKRQLQEKREAEKILQERAKAEHEAQRITLQMRGGQQPQGNVIPKTLQPTAVDSLANIWGAPSLTPAVPPTGQQAHVGTQPQGAPSLQQLQGLGRAQMYPTMGATGLGSLGGQQQPQGGAQWSRPQQQQPQGQQQVMLAVVNQGGLLTPYGTAGGQMVMPQTHAPHPYQQQMPSAHQAQVMAAQQRAGQQQKYADPMWQQPMWGVQQQGGVPQQGGVQQQQPGMMPTGMQGGFQPQQQFQGGFAVPQGATNPYRQQSLNPGAKAFQNTRL